MYSHIKQTNPLSCGAACMQMIYDYFNLPIAQEDIWRQIVRIGFPYGIDCGPEQMQRHFHTRGFSCIYVVAIGNISLFLPWVEEIGLSAIVNYTIKENLNHFVLFERACLGGAIVQDPLASKGGTFIPYEKLREPQVMLITKGTQKVRCPHCKTSFPSCDIATSLYGQHVSRCAYCCEELFCVEAI